MKPTITVIVPHHNRPEMVTKALASIRGQTLPADEVLLIDDASTPENRAALEQFADLATLVLLPKNLGISGARNFGAQQATGEWLAFLDDDDAYFPDKLERQMRYLAEHPAAQALGGGMTMVAADGHTEYWGGKPTRQLTLADTLRNTASLSQALLIRREVFLAHGGFDASLRYMEDYELGIRLLRSGVDMHFLAEPLFLYRWGGGHEQATGRWGRMLRSELRVILRHRAAARTAFGRFGTVRLIGGCCRKWGLRRGRVLGRLMWLAGVVLEGVFGRLPGLTT